MMIITLFGILAEWTGHNWKSANPDVATLLNSTLPDFYVGDHLRIGGTQRLALNAALKVFNQGLLVGTFVRPRMGIRQNRKVLRVVRKTERPCPIETPGAED